MRKKQMPHLTKADILKNELKQMKEKENNKFKHHDLLNYGFAQTSEGFQ